MSVHDLAERLERAYRIALLLQGRLADRGDHSDEAAFEPMTLAVELVALLDDARAALLRQAMPCPALSYRRTAPAPADMRRGPPQDASTACTVHAPSARRAS